MSDVLKALLEGEMPNGHMDLLVQPEKLIKPAGKRLQRKRSLMRQFEAACPRWSSQPITKQNIDEAYALERRWQTDGDSLQQSQLVFVRRCFRYFSEFDLCGVLLNDGQNPVGYSISTRCGSKGGYILVLRVLPVPAGGGAVLYRETALQLARHVSELNWINLGWLGGSAEERTRLSYEPMTLEEADEMTGR